MHYVDRDSCTKPVKAVILQLETCDLYFSWPGQSVPCDENGRPAYMTIGELKEAVSYYSELFDKRPNRFIEKCCRIWFSILRYITYVIKLLFETIMVSQNTFPALVLKCE